MECCKEPKCNSPVRSRGWCAKHYKQWQRYGYIPARLSSMPNEIVKKDTYALVRLYNNKSKVIASAKIDIEDIKRVKSYKWCLDSKGYAKNPEVGMLHNFVMKIRLGKVYDHINSKPLDCRKDNLRVCTQRDNSRNTKVSKSNTTGAKGVYWLKVKNRFHARITVDGKRIHLGYFGDLIEAARAYNKAAKKYFGEFAKCNNIKKLKESLC